MPKVVKRTHPRGELGTSISIEEVARRATEGRVDPKTVAWAREKLAQAGWPQTKLAQAEALLAALRRERHYVDDPTDAEFIPSAACTLEGCDGLTFLGEDCDGLLVSFLSACGAVGIWGAVVAHAYDPSGNNLTHVLAAVYDGEYDWSDTSKGNWIRCDPSTNQPFGTVSKPTREKMVLVPGGAMLCDQKPTCGAPPTDIKQYLPSEGTFVGVGKPKAGSGTMGLPSSLTPFDNPVEERAAAEQLGRDMRLALGMGSEVLKERYRRRRYLEMSGVKLDNPSWTPANDAQINNMVVIDQLAARYVREAESGKRKLWKDSATGEVIIGGTEAEPYLEASGNALVARKAADGQDLVALVDPSKGIDGAVSGPEVAVAAPVATGVYLAYAFAAIVAIGTIAYGIYTIHSGYLASLQADSEEAKRRMYEENRKRLVESGVSEADAQQRAMATVAAMQDTVNKEVQERSKAFDIESDAGLIGAVKTVAYAMVIVSVLGAVGYGMQAFGGKR